MWLREKALACHRNKKGLLFMDMILTGAVAQGLLWGIMTIGVYLTYKVLDYSDLTVDGSIALGGAVTASLIVKGLNPALSLFVSITAGAIAGAVTGLLHTKLKIPPILSGILTMLGLYSVNIAIMGRANTSLLGLNDVFTLAATKFGISNNMAIITIASIVGILVVLICYWFFGTEIGTAIRATGSNEYMVRALGGNTDNLKIYCLMLSNGLVALSGGLIAQSQGYAEVSMGTGSIIIGLASVIIGQVIFGSNGKLNFGYKLLTAVLGSIVYRVIISIVLYLGLNPNNLKLFTAIMVALALSLPEIKKWAIRKV